MRRVLFIAALFAVLAACSPKTPEGARCSVLGGTGECPEGQRCGQDFQCSIAAVSCADIECSATICDSNTLKRCVVTGPCSAYAEETCSNASQTCDAVNQACQCVDAQGCTGEGSMCSVDRTATIACGSENQCPFRTGDGTPHTCDLGQVCLNDFPNARCDCPAKSVALNQGCDSEGETACAGDTLLTCHLVGSGCFHWTVARDCTTDGLHCGIDGTAACLCPAPAAGGRLLADPTSAADPAVRQNGAVPALCRFKTLSAAVFAASAGVTVKATGSGSSVLFQEPGFTIKSGVSVVGDETAPVAPANVVIELSGAGTQGLVLASGASLSGVTVRRATRAAATIGIDVQGQSPEGGYSLSNVALGKAATTDAFTTNVLVSGTGAVTVQRLTARDATAAGLEIARNSIADAVAVSDSTLDTNGVGLKLTKGTLTLVASSVRSNATDGVVADGGAVGTTSLSVAGGTVIRNGGTGIVASLNDTLHLSGVRICANSGSLRVLAAGSRTAGGVYLLGDAPADLLFKGNLVHHNNGDQVLVGASGSTRWNLATASCAEGERNVFAGYQGSSGDGGVGVTAVSAKVDAWWNAWKTTSLPATLVDFVALGTGAEVNARGSGAEYCEPPGLLDTDCPP